MEFNYVSPGAAASDAIYDVMLQRQKEKQIAFQNNIVSRREAREEEDVRARHEYEMANLKRQQAKDAEAETDKQREQLRREVQSRFIKGDYMNDPELNSRIKKLGMEGEFFDPEAAQPGPPPALGSQLGPPQPGGAIPGMQTPAAPIEPPKPAALRFAGTAAQRQDDVKRQTQMAFLQDASNPEGRFSQLLKTNPAAADAVYTNAMGHPMPASMVRPPEQKQYVLDPATSELKEVGSVPGGSHVVTRPAGQSGSSGPAPDVTPYRPDPKTGNTPDPRTGLTPNAVYQDAVAFALQGTIPAMGLGTATQVREARFAIQNKSAAMATAAGVDLASLRAEYAAKKGALGRMTSVYVQTSASAGTADDNLQLAKDQAAKVGRIDVPIANTFTQWLQSGDKALIGNPDLAQLQLYIYTASREYAKVVSGSAASIQGLTDTASHQVDKLLSAAQTPDTFAAVITAMQKDMDNVTKNQLKQVNGVSGTIASFLSNITGEPIPTGGSSATPKKKTDWRSIYDEVYGKKGGGD